MKKPRAKAKAKSSGKRTAKATRAKSKSKPSTRARANVGNSAKPRTRSSGTSPRARLSPRQKAAKKAAATRARLREELALAEVMAKRGLAAQRGAKTRKRRRAARERQGIIEAKLAQAPKRTQEVYDRLTSALERMRRRAGFPLDLEFDVPPAEEGTSQLWLVRGTFRPSRAGFTYSDLALALRVWADDLQLATTVHPQRICFIRWHYTGGRKEGGYSPSGLGAWDRVVDEAAGDAEEFEERYSESEIDYVSVQFAARTLTGPVVRL